MYLKHDGKIAAIKRLRDLTQQEFGVMADLLQCKLTTLWRQHV